MHLTNRTAEIALPLQTLFVATSTSLPAILDFVTFASVTEVFVNRHYGFNSFSPADANAQVGPHRRKVQREGCSAGLFLPGVWGILCYQR
jgi:hypothetical protein